MVGKKDMTLFGWKQLIQWSLEHSCMAPAEKAGVTRYWQREWDEFLHWVVDEYGATVP
jgi:adenosine deaminase CECR1